MQVNDPSTSEILILAWFALSVFVAVVGTVVLSVWLRRRGVRLVSGFVGIPGYLEYAYFKYCQSHERASTSVLVLRAISIINAVVAAIVTIPILAGK